MPECDKDSLCCGGQKYCYRLSPPKKPSSHCTYSNEGDACSVASSKYCIAEKIKNKYEDITRAFHNFDSHNTGKVLRSQLKQVLRTYCYHISDCDFNQLVVECLIDPRGKVDYTDFLDKITGWDSTKLKQPSPKPPIPRCVSIDELEIMLQAKIKKNMKNIIRGFILYDYAHDGHVQKREMRKVLENYCFKFSTEQYNNLWNRYDPERTGVVCYENFLVKLGVNVDRCRKYLPKETVSNALCWTDKAVSDSEKNARMLRDRKKAAYDYENDPCIRGKTLDEIVKIFLSKLTTQGMDVTLCNACHMFDKKNSGFIPLVDFHGVLNQFVLPMSWALYIQILEKCVPMGATYKKICWKAFVQQYCQKKPVEFPIYKGNRVPANKRVIEAIAKIRMRVINPKDRIGGALQLYDHNGRRVFTRSELKRVIHRQGFTLTDEEFRDMFALLDPNHSNFISVNEFFALFEYPETKPCDVEPPVAVKKIVNQCKLPNYRDPERCNKKDEDLHCEDGESDCRSVSIIGCGDGTKEIDTSCKSFPGLHDNALKRKIRHYFNKNYDYIARSLEAADYHHSGKVHLGVLRSIVHNYIFPLTNDQWGEIMSDFTTYKNEIFYNIFLNFYKKWFSDDVENWIKNVNRLMDEKKQADGETEQQDIEEYIRDSVLAKKNALMSDFAIIDSAKLGCIRRTDFRRLMNKHIVRLNDDQFAKFWWTLPKSETGRVRYEAFLSQYMCLNPESRID